MGSSIVMVALAGRDHERRLSRDEAGAPRTILAGKGYNRVLLDVSRTWPCRTGVVCVP
jgi:hypothetical protein